MCRGEVRCEFDSFVASVVVIQKGFKGGLSMRPNGNKYHKYIGARGVAVGDS